MRAVVLAAILAVALASGCGGDAADAEDTVTAAVSGLAKGDQKKVCDQLTAGAQTKLLKVLAHNPIGDDIHATTCGEAITKLYHQLSKPIRAVLYDGEVGEAQLDGDKAMVHVVGAGMDVELEKISGTWKITGGLLR
jgi:hypothetical protein